MVDLLQPILRFSFIGYFLIAWLLWRLKDFPGRGWLILGLMLWGVQGLGWQVIRFSSPADAEGFFAVLVTIGVLGLGSLLVGGFVFLRSRGGGEGLLSGFLSRPDTGASDPDQATSMVPRNETNGISSAEAVRDRIYEAFQSVLDAEEIGGEVFRSPPYSATIWVQLRVQEPAPEDEGLSLRGTATVVIEPKEFHRFDHELTVEVDDGKKTRTYRSVVELSPEDVSTIAWYLANRTPSLRLRPRRCRVFPWQLWRPKNKLSRLKPDRSAATWLALAGLVLLGVPLLGIGLLLAAGIVWLVGRESRRRVLSLTSGKPLQEPRMLVRMDSWQAVLYELGSYRDELADQISRDLSAGPPQGAESEKAASGAFTVAEEEIWYPGIDGKVERRQSVVRLRRAIGFVHLYTYGEDLYVGWDAHINGGTWIEKLLGQGRELTTGKLARAYGITSAWHSPNEYDITDASFLAEGIHSIVTKTLKRALQEHEIDQEIDFAIVREPRQGIAGRDKPSEPQAERKPRFRRVA